MRHNRRRREQKRILLLGLLALIFSASGCATKSSAPSASQTSAGERTATEAKQLRDIQVVDQIGYLNVLLIGSDAMTYTAFKAIDPLRLVVDLPNTESEIASSPLAVENEIVGKVETIMLSMGPQPMTRVEIGLNKETPYEIIQEQNQIRVQFETGVVLTEVSSVEAESVPESETVVYQTEPQAVTSTSQPSAEESSLPAKKITAIQPIASDDKLKVYIIGDGSLGNYNVFTLTDPARLVLDLMGVESVTGKGNIPSSDNLVKEIRVGAHTDKVRVVFDLIPAAGLPYQVTAVGDRRVVSFEPGSGFPASPPADSTST